jgi:hypothetical protein
VGAVRLEVDNCSDLVCYFDSLDCVIKLLLGGSLLYVRQLKHPSMRFLPFWLKRRQMIASLERPKD